MTYSSYIVLARKWRPTQFANIVGQSPTVQTLMNAIRTKRINQAYLLTGSRGIGKTTIARIFSKAIRCQHLKDAPQANFLLACDACPPCLDMAKNNSMDVIEIDGASNNGVESVREIRENVKFLPAIGDKKIYIIDEVHMLSTAAFNALLKTLEEPPPHVIFIFATTEPHKIPATILSRCQRFDLKRVTITQIQNRLQEVATKEEIEIDISAIAILARAAEGSMRDALSLLDQAIAFSGKKITTQNVRDSIGLIESQALLNTLSKILERQPIAAISYVAQAYEAGHDLRIFTKGLIEFLHGIILAKVGASHSMALEFSTEEWEELCNLSKLRAIEELELIFQVFHYGMDWIARSPQPKTVLDILVVKCATAEVLVSFGALEQPKEKPPVKLVVSEHSWTGLISHVKITRPFLASLLEHASCERFPNQSEDLLKVCFPQDAIYFKDQFKSPLTQELFLALCQKYFSKPIRVQVELSQNSTSASESLAQKKERENTERENLIRTQFENHTVVKETVSLFNGELGPIEFKLSNVAN
ncbi:MAG: DNA polymerase III subunit gamma/tau [Bdellovibrio sp.]|nr:DNA polymerase III subunit gamma/tau [Bdellovibrio sp.]